MPFEVGWGGSGIGGSGGIKNPPVKPWTPPIPQSWGNTPPSPPSLTGFGGGGGGSTPVPSLAPWGGAIPGQDWLGMSNVLPWGDWGSTPWANAPEGRSEEAMAWLNTWLPWYQQALSQSQFQDQLSLTQSLEDQRTALQQELANMQTFGRRTRPDVRYL